MVKPTFPLSILATRSAWGAARADSGAPRLPSGDANHPEPKPTNTSRDAPRWLLPALAIASLHDDVPERRMLSAWLDSWCGAREVIDAMTDRGYNVRLSQSPFGWWAEFCRAQVSPLPKWIGRGHDTTTPGRAVRFAALDTLRRAEAE
jgi:hypothetical protein